MLWQKNFACATQLNRDSSNYAAIAGEHVTVVTWACPSGDVLITVESATEESMQRSVWIALEAPQQRASLFEGLVQEALAAAWPLYAGKRADPVIAVLCQKWLKNKKLILRRIRRANGRCIDEVINPRTGRVLKRQKASCDRKC